MGAAEEKFLSDRQAEKDRILSEIERNRTRCLDELIPRLRQLYAEFHELNESLGFPQPPEAYSDSDAAAGWYVNKIQLPNQPYEKNDYYHHDRVWLTNGTIARYIYNHYTGPSGRPEDIVTEYSEAAFVSLKIRADVKSMPYGELYKSEDKIKELLQYIKIVHRRIELLQRMQSAPKPRKPFSFKEWFLGYK